MDPNSSDQNTTPKPTSSVGNVIPAQTPAQEPPESNPLEQPPTAQNIPQEPQEDLSVPKAPASMPQEPAVSKGLEENEVTSSDSGSDNSQNKPQEFYPKGARVNRKIVLSAIVLIMVITIPLTVFVARQPQSTQSGAAQELTPDTVIAVFNGQNILEKDLETVALEQYDGGSIDREVLKDSLDILIERKILEQEKSSKGIAVTDEEVAAKVEEEFDQNQAVYEVLKDKITKTQTKNWQVYTIGFWVPAGNDLDNLTNQEKDTRKKRLDDGLKALDVAQNQFSSQKTVLSIAKDLAKKYPSLTEILGVNGYLLQDADNDNEEDYTNPRIYTFEKSNKGQPFFDDLYSMKNAGQIKKVLNSSNSGGNVIKLVKANTNAQFDNYEDWLSAKKKNIVTVVYNL